ncbi:MAG: hypothetical protein JNJ88_02900 [Planctomycetes bacterium]|nr:hypothetical protein [Planctomycetota bacterium]
MPHSAVPHSAGKHSAVAATQKRRCSEQSTNSVLFFLPTHRSPAMVFILRHRQQLSMGVFVIFLMSIALFL